MQRERVRSRTCRCAGGRGGGDGVLAVPPTRSVVSFHVPRSSMRDTRLQPPTTDERCVPSVRRAPRGGVQSAEGTVSAVRCTLSAVRCSRADPREAARRLPATSHGGACPRPCALCARCCPPRQRPQHGRLPARRPREVPPLRAYRAPSRSPSARAFVAPARDGRASCAPPSSPAPSICTCICANLHLRRRSVCTPWWAGCGAGEKTQQSKTRSRAVWWVSSAGCAARLSRRPAVCACVRLRAGVCVCACDACECWREQ